jgi:hypothetical protein
MVRDVEREWIAGEEGPGCGPLLGWLLLALLLLGWLL